MAEPPESLPPSSPPITKSKETPESKGDSNIDLRKNRTHSTERTSQDDQSGRTLWSRLRAACKAGKALLPNGWRCGASMAAISSLVILILNVSAFLHAIARPQGQGSIVELEAGTCNDIRRKSSLIHVAINIASSLLLGGSSFVMQCLCAPTRAEIDRAHGRGAWLDIGVLSFRNLRRMIWSKRILWILLALSSIPLHLFFNSVVFVSSTSHYYEIFFANDQFEQGSWFDPALFNSSYVDEASERWPNFVNPVHVQRTIVSRNPREMMSNFVRLEPKECMKTYANRILSSNRNLVIVTSTTPSNNNALHFQSPDTEFRDLTQDPFPWNCSTSPDLENIVELSALSCMSNSSLYGFVEISMPPVPWSIPLHSNWFHWICSQTRIYLDYITLYNGTRLIPAPSLRVPAAPEKLCGDGQWNSLYQQDEWHVFGFKVDYCLSEIPQEQCRLKMHTWLFLVVIAFNSVKFVIFLIVIVRLRDDPLITIGDAIDSFLQHIDKSTQRSSLIGKNDIIRLRRRRRNKKKNLPRRTFRLPFTRTPTSGNFLDPLSPKQFTSGNFRRWSAASKQRWGFSSFLTFCAVSAILGLLGYVVPPLKSAGRTNLADLGLGNFDPYTVILDWKIPTAGDSAVIGMALMSNLPQALMSVLYVFFNGILTSISQTVEWSKYAHEHRTLRVSGIKPAGQQRSTYFLQVPYRLGVPFLLSSSLIHWLISQSLFMVQVVTRSANGRLWPERLYIYSNMTTCCFSPLGMICTSIAITLLFLYLVTLGSRKLQLKGMPLVGSCSLAIAAACHAPTGTSPELPLKWGVIPPSNEEEWHDGSIGHCAFSNEDVEQPVIGRLYA